MTVVRIVFLFLLFLFTSSAFASSTGKKHCDDMLSLFLRSAQEVREGRGDDELEKQVERALEIEGQQEDRDAFSESQKLAPLFDSGIVHQAIAKELASQGRKTAKDIRNSIAAFPYLATDAEKIAFVDAVFLRLAYQIQDDISLDAAHMKKVEKQAKRYKMSVPEYLRFVGAWQAQDSDFLAIKIAILRNMMAQEAKFTKAVAKHAGRWRRVISALRREKDNEVRPLGPLKDLPVISLVTASDSNGLSLDALANFVDGASLLAIRIFVDENYLRLTWAQLKACLENNKARKAITSELQDEIGSRLAQMKPLAESYEKVRAQLEFKTREINELNELIATKEAELNSVGIVSLSKDEMQIVFAMLGDINNFATSTTTNKGAKQLFDNYAARMNGPQFVEIASLATSLASHYQSGEKRNELLLMINEASRSVNLTPEEVVKIKTAVQQQAALNKNSDTTTAGYAILARGWGKPAGRSAAISGDLDGKKAELSRQIDEDRKNLALLVAAKKELEKAFQP